MNLLDLYESQKAPGQAGENARALLAQTHWFTANADFDPKTGEALPQALSAYLAKVAHKKADGKLQDRLYRITEHARPSVERLFRTLNESPRREHALLPVRAVRELDASSFIKLSNRPGRNIREKLAGKPYLQAVRRYQSVNLPENRLLKAFVTRLAALLELRQDCLGEPEDELLPKIQSWLVSEEAHEVARWENLPPNNTLLSHRDYRRVWDAWRWLQTLDDDIARDLSQLERRAETMRLWDEYGSMYLDGKHLFAEMPVLFDFEEFDIRPWTAQLAVQKVARKIARTFVTKSIREPVCVDLAMLRPQYAITRSARSLSETYLWQQWKNDDGSVDIDLFISDAAYLYPDAISIRSTDLFFSKDNTSEHCDRAARAFAGRLRDVFKDATLIWLVPDFLNDFELEITRRNLNARFSDAEPLPRSVAAVFEQVDYTVIKNDGYPIVVVDTIGGRTCVTKFLARFDQELKKRLPETNGFYWERCPTVLSRQDAEEAAGKGRQYYDIVTVDDQGRWRKRHQEAKPQWIDPNTLKCKQSIGSFEFCINVIESPVAGGIRFHALQQRASNIPLWRDQIPELSVKVMRGGRYQRFHLVSRGTTVKPIRGVSVRIPVREDFMLLAGKPFYQFPLFQGANADELGFSAQLDSPSFPLKEDTACKLNLTFEYGADEPYKLIFTPFDKSFPPVRATWQRPKEITDAPAPKYPEPMSWTDLRSVPKPGSEKTSDLLNWFMSAIDRLDHDLHDLFIRPCPRIDGTVIAEWCEDRYGNHFAFAKCVEANSYVFIHEHSFVEGVDFSDFPKGKRVSFKLRMGEDGRYSGWEIAEPNYREETRLRNCNVSAIEDVVAGIYRRLYYPSIQIWRDGRSLTDKTCPKQFSKEAGEKIAYLSGLVDQAKVPQPIRKRLLFLLACFHKDTPADRIQWITDQVVNGNIHDPRAIGFSLGDLSQRWQQSTFRRLVSHPDNAAISIFAYAIWREQHFVEKFSVSELQATLNTLSQRLGNIDSEELKRSKKRNEREIRHWVRAAAEPLELLLGLLRTRASTDPEIKMLLQPHQKITKQLAEQIDRMEDIIAQANITLFSRVQLNIQKPDGVRTPDLLYALRLYLTGDDGANAIHITNVSEDDNG